MKTLKLAAFAIALGFFAASCGGNTESTETPTDTAAVAPEAQPEVAPAPEATPAPVDTAAAAPAADTAAKAK
ncbi:MAG: hypothetical protein WC756_07275 [Taibaiella sp.]|jgi:hypothetical protein